MFTGILRLLRRRRFEQNLSEELAFHVEARVADLVSRGVPQAEAERQARIEFGSFDKCRERCRESVGFRPFAEAAQDLRYALRLYRKSPGFSAIAILCLALGAGVNTSMFSMMNYILLKPLPVPDAASVVSLSRGQRSDMPYPIYREFRDRAQSLSGLAATARADSTLDIGNEASGATAEAVTANYGAVLRLKPYLGRWINNESEPSVVLSYRAWRDRFHADPAVLGKVIRSEKRYWTVIGVAPPEFPGIFAPLSTDLWVPLRLWAEQHPAYAAALEDRTRDMVVAVGRLRDGHAPERAAAELNAIDLQERAAARDSQPRPPLAVEPARGIVLAQFRHGAGAVSALLMALGATVLLIASVNIANLLLAKGIARQAEMSVRMSLGAGPGRVFRQMLIETSVLAVFGGAAGLLAGGWMNELIRALFAGITSPGQSIRPDLSLDHRVFLSAWVTSLVAALACGVAPAWRSARLDIVATLKCGAQGSRLRLQSSVLVIQVAASLVLLCCATMFLRGWSQLRSADPGFAVDRRVYAEVFASEPEFTPETAHAFFHAAVDRLRTQPGIQGAALTLVLPPYGRSYECVALEGGSPLRVTEARIGDGFLSLMGIALRQGREFSPLDRNSSAPGVVISETLARRLWPGGDAVGREVKAGCQYAAPALVLGVARDLKPGEAHLYRPLPATQTGRMILVVAGSPFETANRVRAALQRSGIRIYAVKPVAEHVDSLFWQVRWEALLLGIFGALALALAAVGLYGTMAYNVSRRTREFGIRIALGAGPAQVLWCVARRALRLTAAGIGIGILLSLGACKLVSSFLFGLGPFDWPSLVGPAAIWMAVALAACAGPAIRALRIATVRALREA